MMLQLHFPCHHPQQADKALAPIHHAEEYKYHNCQNAVIFQVDFVGPAGDNFPNSKVHSLQT